MPNAAALTDEQQALLRRVVDAGHFGSPEAALAAALDELRERADKHARLKREIQKGLDSGPGDSTSFAEIARQARARWQAEQAPEDHPDAVRSAAE